MYVKILVLENNPPTLVLMRQKNRSARTNSSASTDPQNALAQNFLGDTKIISAHARIRNVLVLSPTSG